MKSSRSRAGRAKPAPALDERSFAAALRALGARDEKIAAMLAVCGAPPLRRREAGFAGLCWIVVGQQVSTASAQAIFARLEAGFPGLDPARIAHADDEALRACGLSRPKVKTLRILAGAVVDGALDFAALAAMDAQEAHAALCAHHGIGPWSADIFLLFSLGCADAFPAGDLALQEAARLGLNLRARPDARRLTKIAERWRPHRGVAAHVLWAYYKARLGR
ncbi:MAG: DNA-3-methyladenine glycosylase 2 family protein [Hyphomicrobiales bacterium]|nr:DNA-3-methyladenine glycosylase 2 family protein [Hyphomicrobiales bacterium]